MNTNWHDLIQRYISGTITDAEAQSLEEQLKSDPELRDWYLDALNLDSALEATAESAQTALSLPVPLSQRALAPARPGSARWFSWRPLTAAAAGIVFGMLCTSMVFGFGVRSIEKVLSLLHESFESGPAPQVKGVPSGPDLWSGDYSEIVTEFEDAKPEDGSRMARLLRTDHEGRTVPRPSRQGDLMRVLDVRPLFLSDAKGGDVVMTLSAQFNAAPFPNSERYDGMVTIYALGADTNLHGATEDSVKEEALAFSVGECRNLDRDPGTWQAASTRLLLPPGTESVMVKVSFRRMPVGAESLSSLPESLTFAGHFVDDVRASIRIREAAPHHRTQELP
jgi:hypothetical protein